jgi:hypothetical protein
MKAVISTTYSDTYLFFLPIVTYCWNKLGVDVICFSPEFRVMEMPKLELINQTMQPMKCDVLYFKCPEHKESTYAQCSRLYASALDLPEDEVLITSDVDMALFKIPENMGGFMSIFGHDLVPPKQVPICYLSGAVAEWRKRFKIMGRTYQECLDDLLGAIEADHFRGNYWAKDQEEAYNRIMGDPWPSGHAHLLPRAKPGTQFATNRLDRDDAFLLERLSPEIIDYHMSRPGFEENNFNQILTVLKYYYPEDSFDWLKQYREQYIQLLLLSTSVSYI